MTMDRDELILGEWFTSSAATRLRDDAVRG
jgi:hypothetical protein